MKYFILIIIVLYNVKVDAQTFVTTPGTFIVDGSPFTTNLNVTGIGSIGCVQGLDQVCIDITHTYDADIELYLIDPQGTTYELTTGNGGSGNNYQNTCFDMSAANNVTSGSAPFNGTYVPEGDFGLANNDQDADGIWQLSVNDNAGGDTGFLNSFSLIFAPLAECLPPVVEDCRGGTTLCSDASFSGNASGSGHVTDLDASNHGCLLSNEHESSWYYFQAQTSGTIEMIIGTTVDYDFAIWGPFVGDIDCPPTSVPIRCSYSGTTGDTGLQLGSGDLNEGSGGDKFVDPIIAAAGDKFILLIDNFSADGTVFTLDWTLSGGASLNCVPLPVTFSDFSVTRLDDSNLIAWKTYSESNNSHFLIQKLDSDGSYYTIKTIFGQGNSSSITPYFYEDYRPKSIINFYRILQVDFDGQQTIFSPKSVDNTLEYKTITNRYNLLGQEVNISYVGIVILHYKDGSSKKIYQSNP